MVTLPVGSPGLIAIGLLVASACGQRRSSNENAPSSSTPPLEPIVECRAEGALVFYGGSARGEQLIVADRQHADPDLVVEAITRHARRRYPGAIITRYQLPSRCGAIDLEAQGLEMELYHEGNPPTRVSIAQDHGCIYTKQVFAVPARKLGRHTHPSPPCAVPDALRVVTASGVPSEEPGFLDYDEDREQRAFGGSRVRSSGTTELQWRGERVEWRLLDPKTCKIWEDAPAPPPEPPSEEEGKKKKSIQSQLDEAVREEAAKAASASRRPPVPRPHPRLPGPWGRDDSRPTPDVPTPCPTVRR